MVFSFNPKPSKVEIEDAAKDCLGEGQVVSETFFTSARKEVAIFF
jgi:hypothetical protein